LAKLIDRKIAGPEKIQTIVGLIEMQIETWIEWSGGNKNPFMEGLEHGLSTGKFRVSQAL